MGRGETGGEGGGRSGEEVEHGGEMGEEYL